MRKPKGFKCPAIACGKRFITEEHLAGHIETHPKDELTPMRKGWVTPDGFVDFSYPVSYAHACGFAKSLVASLREKHDGR